jgi:hypothetical protein
MPLINVYNQVRTTCRLRAPNEERSCACRLNRTIETVYNYSTFLQRGCKITLEPGMFGGRSIQKKKTFFVLLCWILVPSGPADLKEQLIHPVGKLDFLSRIIPPLNFV